MNVQMKSEPHKKFAEPLDLNAGPLEGVHLVEAGAGTGKTYALTALFTRLILERGLRVDEILVVTFTVAATKELRGRIRQKLREALDAFTSVREGDDFVQLLVKKIDPAAAVPRLGEALRDFDLASIFTIHSFCQRMLREHAFESGAVFDTELLADDSELRAEVLEDFWRTRFYPAHPEFFRYAVKSCGIEKLKNLLAKGTAQPQIDIVPDVPPFELPPLGPIRDMLSLLQKNWPGERETILAELGSPFLNKTKYGKPEKIAAALETYLSGSTVLNLPKDFEKLTPEYLAAGVKKGGKSPEHPFFEKCGELSRAVSEYKSVMDRKILSLKSELFSYFRSEFSRRKENLNIQSFNDLLTRMDKALKGELGEALAAAVRRRYRAALVDEFQDTDPAQYSIFSSIFGKAGGALYLIGDPKQAIYGFRGADLFTYLQASAEVENTHTLLTNRRSEPELIDAVNALFSRPGNPFLFKDIEFRKASSEYHDKSKVLTFEGKRQPPFHLWLMPSSDKPIAKNRARKIIADAVALEIKKLVALGRAGHALLGGKPLIEADIAVLVRKHKEARIIQTALREKGIISVLYSDADLFRSNEAIELERVLRAIAEPSSESAFRAALASDIIGASAEALESLLADGPRKEERQACFRKWRETWERRGFLVMYRQLLDEEKVRERLVSWPDGERRITNYLHLGEILHREEAGRSLGTSSLVDWLALRRSEQVSQAPEERQLRLESDADAVKVITIHMSKGLEFPIVFCPFNWDGRMDFQDSLLYHEKKDGWRLNLALASPGPETQGLAKMEMLAEGIRLLYVSVTRARNRCYLVWGRIKDSCTSPPAYILHPIKGEPATIVDDLKHHVESLSHGQMLAAAVALQKESKGSVHVGGIPLGPGPDLPEEESARFTSVLREFNSPVERDWKISSFSSLAVSRKALPESPDHDSGPEDLEPRPNQMAITDFPRGPHAGNFFHELFEEMDFGNTAGLEDLTAEKLIEHGYGTEWTAPVSAMARNVLAADLDEEGLRLGSVKNSERLKELGFYIPLHRITPASLRGVFAKFTGENCPYPEGFPERLGGLEFDPCRGFMRGFIDLVFSFRNRFYLVDWKSNFLGHGPGDYAPSRLNASMAEHFYFLQYHLYCLALHKYLRLRLPGYSYEKHFGGVFYIYLRGFGAPGKSGIFRDRPQEDLIRALEKELVRPRQLLISEKENGNG